MQAHTQNRSKGGSVLYMFVGLQLTCIDQRRAINVPQQMKLHFFLYCLYYWQFLFRCSWKASFLLAVGIHLCLCLSKFQSWVSNVISMVCSTSFTAMGRWFMPKKSIGSFLFPSEHQSCFCLPAFMVVFQGSWMLLWRKNTYWTKSNCLGLSYRA